MPKTLEMDGNHLTENKYLPITQSSFIRNNKKNLHSQRTNCLTYFRYGP